MSSLHEKFIGQSFLTAEADFVGQPVEAFSLEEQKGNLMIAGESIITDTRDALYESTGWLPFFAEEYNISPDIKDYVLVPISIFLSGLPNKKGHAFTVEELTSADPMLGCLKYESWKRKPCFEDHVNKDHTKARGIILSSTMRPAPQFEGNLWKIVCLQAFDRRTYPQLSNNILTGAINSYSMGAYCRYWNCSICEAEYPEGRCGHIHPGMYSGKQRFEKFQVFNDKLAYLDAHDITGFEVSALNRNNPAFEGARNTPEELMMM